MDMAMDTEPRSKLRKTLIATGAGAIAGFLAAFSFLQLAESGVLGTLQPSQEVAGLVGIIYMLCAAGVGVGLAIPSVGAKFLNVEDAEELHEQQRMLTYSVLGMISLGLALLVAALAAPAGPIGAEGALAGFIALIALGWWAGSRQRRHTDELMNSISRETTSLAFYLLFLCGGGWALLAHLGFAVGPQPLDWLTMFAGLMLVATFGVCAKRGMLVMR